MRNSKGQFDKGNAGKPKGATSKKNQDIKDNLKELLEDNLPKLKEDLAELEAKDRVNAILSLVKYYVPALRATEMTVDDMNRKTEFKPIVIDFTD